MRLTNLVFFILLGISFVQGQSISPAADQTICQGEVVILSVKSAAAGSTFQWKKNNANITDSTRSELVVSASGKYDVVVTDNTGSKTITGINVTVNAKPTANFTFSPSTGCGVTSVKFTNTSTNGTGGSTGLSYKWDFGDGGTSTSSSPTHKFTPTAGTGNQTFSITLITTQINGCKDTLTKDLTLGMRPDSKLLGPGATTINGEPYFNICSSVGNSVSFANGSSTNATNTQYIIRWGDGTADYNSTTFSAAVSHVYPVGVRKLTFIVYSPTCVDSTVYTVFVGNIPAGGLVGIGGTTICKNEEQRFLINGTGNNPPGTRYVVSYTDGTKNDTFYHPAPDTISHTFPKSSCGITSSNGFQSFPNSFGAYISITNPCGLAGGSILPIYVSDKPEAKVSSSPKDTICEAQTITFNNVGNQGSTVIDGVCTTGKFIWRVSSATPGASWTITSGKTGTDNNTTDALMWVSGTSSLVIKFNKPGIYDVTLVMANNSLCGVSTDTKTICVNPLPTAAITVPATVGCAPFNLKATGISNAATCSENKYVWSVTFTPAADCVTPVSNYTYVNGTNENSHEPEFKFNAPGVYTLSLQTFAPGGLCSSTIATQEITVKDKPIITMTAPPDACQSATVNPTLLANCYTTNATYNWSLTGGTATGTTTTTPSVVYSTIGNYTIAVDVTNECGVTSASQPIVIKTKPEVNIPADVVVCAGAAVAPQSFSSVSTNTVFTWTSDNAAIGLASSGTGSTPSFNAINNGTSTVTANVTAIPDLNTCVGDPKTFKITIHPNPVLQSQSATICKGASTDLNVSGADSYLWSPSANLNKTFGSTVTASPVSTTTYTVKGTVATTGCNTTIPVLVTVNPLPNVSVTSPSVCDGKSVNITASGNSVSYEWDASSELNTTSGATVTATPVATSTYKVTGTSSVGCQNTATSTVTVNPNPVVTATNAVICAGQSANITASGANNYAWAPSSGLSATNLSTVSASPTSTSSYIVTGTNSTTGCSSTATSIVTVNPKPVLTLVGGAICPGSSYELNVSGADTYAWQSSSSLSILTGTPVTATPSTTTTYSVTGTNATTGCTNTANATVKVTILPVITGSYSNPTSCFGTEGTITISNLDPSTTYTVGYKHNGTPFTFQIPSNVSGMLVINGLSSGTYSDVYVGLNGCISNFIGPFNLSDPLPPATPVVANPGLVCSGTSLTMTVTNPVVGATYSWTGPNGFTSTVSNPTVVIPNVQAVASGTYQVQIISKNCSSTNGSFNVSIKQSPTAPVVNSPLSYCQASTVPALTATADAGHSLLWYTAASGGVGSSSAPTPSTAATGSITYYVSQSSPDGCESPRASITVITKPVANISSTFSNPTTCGGAQGRITLTGFAPSTTYDVSYTKDGTTKLNALKSDANGNIMLDNLFAGNYTDIFGVLNGCESNRLNGILLVDPNPPAQPTFSSINSLCSGQTLTLTINNPEAGALYHWIGPNGFTSVTGNYSVVIPNTTTSNAGTYTVYATKNDCSSASGSISVVINQTPLDPTVNPTLALCQGSIVSSLTATIDPVNQALWYDYASGGTGVTQAPTPITASIGSTIYYVSQKTPAGCESGRVPITVNVAATPFLDDKILKICSGDPISFVHPDAVSGTLFRWTAPVVDPVGSVSGTAEQLTAQATFIQNLVNIGSVDASLVYTITPSIAACIGKEFKLNVTVGARPKIANVIAKNICSGSTVSFKPDASLVGNVIPSNTLYTWTIKSISPASSITGATASSIAKASLDQTLINLNSTSATIVYELTPYSNACVGQPFTVTMTVDPTPRILDMDQVICSGSSFLKTPSNSITGNLVPSNTLYTWTMPLNPNANTVSGIGAQNTGVSSIGQTLVNATTLSQQVTYTVTPTAGSCSGSDFKVIITINPQPAISNKSHEICSGTSFSEVPVDAPVGTQYTWSITSVSPANSISGALSNPTPVAKIGQTLTNLGNIPADVTYQVFPTSGTCDGSGFTVVVTVDPTPFVPAVYDSICTGAQFIQKPLNGRAGAIIPLNTTYTWIPQSSVPAGSVTGSSAQFTPQSQISQQLLNSADVSGTLNYLVTPTSGDRGACKGSTFELFVTVHPDAKASFKATDSIGCIPYMLTPNRVMTTAYPGRNLDYLWYVDNKLHGSGSSLPVYTIKNEDDSIMLKLVTTSPFGCTPDSISQKFRTYKLPHPSFEVSDSANCGPMQVLFTNTTPNKSSFNYEWDFGNGQRSNLADPGAIVFYSNPNAGDTVYTVKLSVSTVCDKIEYIRTIRVESKPQALFTPSSSIGCSPFRVTFNNTSKGLGNRYVWDFGDGSKDSSLQRMNMSHTYYTAVRDTFIVKLYAYNGCGKDSMQYNMIVAPNSIKLDFAVNGTDKEGCAPHQVKFINNTDGANAFRWDFGDGNVYSSTKNIDTVSHTYLKPGVYQVLLYATNGCTDTTAVEQITVFGVPSSGFAANKYAVCIGDTVKLENKSSGADSYFWKFSDATNTSLVNPTHVFKTTGSYSVMLYAYKTNAPGVVCTDSMDAIINVVDTVRIQFSLSDSVSNCAPLNVNFSHAYPAYTISQWQFGDGSSSNGNAVTHTYTKTGSYQVNLFVKAAGGCNYISSNTVSIVSPSGTVSYQGGYNCMKESIRFEAMPSSTDSIIWNFGDGVIMRTTDRVVYHSYTYAGAYLPQVFFKSTLGCQFKVPIADTIKVDKVKAGFSFLQEQFCGNTRVDFKDTSSAYYGKKSIQWDLGDATQSSSFVFSHVYSSTNNYLVRTIVTSTTGCTDTAVVSLPVFVRNKPSIQIGGDSVACTGKEMTLDAYVKSQDQITMQKWVASNGNVFYGTQYKNTYAQIASYQFKFIAGTQFGCYDTASVNLQVYPTPVVKGSPDVTICKGNSISINATGADTYTWYPIQGLSCVSCASTIASPVQSNMYTVRGTTIHGCYAYDTINVKVIPDIDITVSADDSICIGQSTPLLASGATYYQWSPADGLSSTTVSNPIAKPDRTTKYRVIGFNEYGCSRDTAYVLVAVGPYPKIDLGTDLLLSTGTIYPFKPNVVNGPIKTWQWEPSIGLSCADCGTPYATIKAPVTYIVKGTTPYGCAASDTISIKVFCENSQVFIPNAFTPDQDGNNDIFMVRARGIQQVKTFKIFNRWGELVFDKVNFPPNDPAYAWDGRFKGVALSSDVFVYTVEVICDDGTPYQYKGNVSLIK